MAIAQEKFNPSSNPNLILSYVADLELEVDRLRRQGQILRLKAREAVEQVQQACRDLSSAEAAPSAGIIAAAAQELQDVLADIHEPLGYHPTHDQVVAIAVRPLIEQTFRWQQRAQTAPDAVLRMELRCEYIEWFPARLRHILDNLISNALKYRDPQKGEARVFLGLSEVPEGYELRVSDNGLGMPWSKRAEAFELFYRAGPTRGAGLGVGVAVVKLLVEQSGGSLTVESGPGQGSSFLVVLPRYVESDYLD